MFPVCVLSMSVERLPLQGALCEVLFSSLLMWIFVLRLSPPQLTAIASKEQAFKPDMRTIMKCAFGFSSIATARWLNLCSC